MRRRSAPVTAEPLRLVRDQAVLAVDHDLLPECAGDRAGCRGETHDSEHSLPATRFDGIGAAAERHADNYAVESLSRGYSVTERRGSRTHPAPGYDASPILKTGWATGPCRSTAHLRGDPVCRVRSRARRPRNGARRALARRDTGRVGKEHGHLDVVAGERVDAVERVEEEDRFELGIVTVHAPQDQGAAVARECARALHARFLEICRIFVGVFRAGRAAPDPGDHASGASDSVSHADGWKALPAQPPSDSTTVSAAFATALRSASGSLM